MGLFGGKKKNGQAFHTLSEKEIQQKLYGSFRTAHLTNPEISLPASPSDRKSSPLTFREPQKNSSSLFIEAPKTAPSSATNNSPESSKTYSEWLQKEESSVAQHARREIPANKPSLPKSQFRPSDEPFKNLTKMIKAFASALMRILAGILAFVRTVVYWLASLHWSNPAVKKSATILLSFAIVVFFLVGIHVLNSRREIAMKSHRPAPPVVGAPTRAEVNTTIKTQNPMELVKSETVSGDAIVSTVISTAERTSSASREELPYVLQIATYALSKDAEDLAYRLKQEDLPAFSKPLKRSGSKTYYCVFLGRFKDYRDAEAELSNFKKTTLAKPFQDAFIRTLD